VKCDVGILEGHITGIVTGTMAMFMHYAYVDAHSPVRNQVGTILVRQESDATVEQLRQLFATQEPPVLVMRQRAFQKRLMSLSGTLPKLLEKVTWFFGISSILVLLSNFFVSLRERRNELGTLRVLGFSRASIVALVLGEAIALYLVAGVIGCGIPFAMYHQQGLHLGDIALADVTVEPSVCLGVLLTVNLVGFFCALVPTMSILRVGTLDLLSDA
jgi:putative ABC transport system permease protein